MIVTATLIMGLVLGALLLFAAVYNFLKKQVFGLGGSVLVVFGTMLLGLSLWQTVELSVDPEGGISAKFEQDLGAESAELKGAIAKLQLELGKVSEDVSLLQAKEPLAAAPESIIKERADIKKQFERNSDYSILVFYKQMQASKAKALENALLSTGYKASATSTDLRESLRQLNINEAWVIYSKRGEKIVSDVHDFLKSLNLNVNYIVNPSSSNLRRGDIQILLF